MNKYGAMINLTWQEETKYLNKICPNSNLSTATQK